MISLDILFDPYSLVDKQDFFFNEKKKLIKIELL